MKPDVFSGKKILVGITGGIAAYKSCSLIRNLKSRGAEVRALMTPSALEFITPLTISTITGNEVIVNIFPADQSNGTSVKTWHIDYGIWADLMIIAPATINTLAKLSYGQADNALTTVASALRCPLLVAPAADMDMYNNPATKENVKRLKERGAFFVEAEEGFLASGLSGPGRMADIHKITDYAESILSGFSGDLVGKKILVTAGPTYEDIDPVRFIGNRSSGKMGYELAKAAYLRGAEVTLVSGPVNLSIYPEIKIEKVRSADEMKEAVEKNLSGQDFLIMSAAVADFKPKNKSNIKIKKDGSQDSISLIENTDILKSITSVDTKIIGFALETNDAEKNAFDKLKSKNLDMIVLNSLEEKGAGFEFDTNKISIIKPENSVTDFELQSKFQTANNILSEILKL